MSLVDTGKAIGKVTLLLKTALQDHFTNRYNLEIGIRIGRPEPPQDSTNKNTINLFLYEIGYDAGMKNQCLYEDQPACLWLVLKYLLTTYETGSSSDTIIAHECLGYALRALQELNYPGIPGSMNSSLGDNPEPLKITFHEATVDLLSKIMQGGDEKYRLSVAFEVRPVMIAAGEPALGSLLVGIDYTKDPAEIIKPEPKGVFIDVIPHVACPVIKKIEPEKLLPGMDVTVYGDNLDLPNMEVNLGPLSFGITSQVPDQLTFHIDESLWEGKLLSAGSYPVSVVQTLSYRRKRTSNLVIGNLLPALESVSASNVLLDGNYITAQMELTGKLLGTDKDDCIVLFYTQGKVAGSIEVIPPPFPDPLPPGSVQTQLEFFIEVKHTILPGIYRVLLLINGQQSLQSPEVNLQVP